MPLKSPTYAQLPSQIRRRITRDGTKPNEQRNAAFRRIIRSIPAGKVSTYGKIAAAAGYPLDEAEKSNSERDN